MHSLLATLGFTTPWPLLLQAFACFFMTGLIWLVQIVHYPAFGFADEKRFTDFHAFHSQRITWIVFPVMTLELTTGVGLALTEPSAFWILNALGVIGIWAATGLVSVPRHNRLALGPSAEWIRSLVLTNWIRTMLWSVRSVTLLFFLAGRISYPGSET